jgi:hypothetical protein
VERHDAAREDRGRRRALGAGRLDQPEHRELVRQLRARRGDRGPAFAEQMEAMYLEDLANATEVVLDDSASRAHPAGRRIGA